LSGQTTRDASAEVGLQCAVDDLGRYMCLLFSGGIYQLRLLKAGLIIESVSVRGGLIIAPTMHAIHHCFVNRMPKH